MSEHDLLLAGNHFHHASRAANKYENAPIAARTLAAFGDVYFGLHDKVAVTHPVSHPTPATKVRIYNPTKPTKSAKSAAKQTKSAAIDNLIAPMTLHDVRATIVVLQDTARLCERMEDAPAVVHTLRVLTEQYRLVLSSMMKAANELEKENES